MNLSWISFDKHNEKSGEQIRAQIQVINDHPICILYNAGHSDLFRNAALENAGFKHSKQNVWVCPIDSINLRAIKAAFPLLEFENVVAPTASVIKEPAQGPNTFLDVMHRSAVEVEYAPDIKVQRYEGPLPPAGESCIDWFKLNGSQVKKNTYTAAYTEATHATITYHTGSRQVEMLFHSPDFYEALDHLHAFERAELHHSNDEITIYNDLVFIRLKDDLFAPATLNASGIQGMISLAAPSPQSVLRSLDHDSKALILSSDDLAAFQEQQEATKLEQKPNEAPESNSGIEEATTGGKSENHDIEGDNRPRNKDSLKEIEKTDSFISGNQAASKLVSEGTKNQTAPFVPESDPVKLTSQVLATFNARNQVHRVGLSANGLETKKDGNLKSIFFDGLHVGTVEGRLGKNKVLKAIHKNACELAASVSDIIHDVLEANLNIPGEHSYSFDKDYQCRWIDTNGNTQLSFYVRPDTPDESPQTEVRTEFRVNLEGSEASAILFIGSGENLASQSIDLIASDEQRFPKAESFQKLAEQMASTFNELAETVGQSIVEERGPTSSQYVTYAKWITKNQSEAQSTGFIREIKMDERLDDGEAERLIALIQDQPQDVGEVVSDNNPSIDSHWAIDLIGGKGASVIQALEDEAERNEATLSWYVLQQEAGLSVIARKNTGAEGKKATHDIVINSSGDYKQLDSSVLNLNLEAGRAKPVANKLETSEEELVSTGKDEQSDGRRAETGGEYGLNGEWYAGGQFMPASAFTVKGKYKVEITQGTGRVLVAPGEFAVPPANQRSIFGKLQNFVAPVEEGLFHELRRNHHSDETLLNFFNSIAQFNAMLDRYNAGERFYSPAWLMSNFSAIPETITSDDAVSAITDNQEPESVKGTPVDIETPINYTAIVRDQGRSPFLVMTKRHGKMQLAPFIDGKPDVHSANPVVDVDGATYFFNNEWYEDDQIIQKPETDKVDSAPVETDISANSFKLDFAPDNKPVEFESRAKGTPVAIDTLNNGKPIVHSESPVVEADGNNYYFNSDWFENDEAIQNDAPTSNEPESREPIFFHNDGLSTLVHTIESKLDNAKGKDLDWVATALNVARRKKGETNSDRINRFKSILECIKTYSNTDKQALETDNNKPVLVDIAKALDTHNSNYSKQQVVDAIYSHFQLLGDNYIAAKERTGLIRQISGLVNRGEFISIELLEAAKGRKALDHLSIYTYGDVQVAMALGDSDIRPKGQRNDKEHFYNACEAFIADPIATLEATDLIDSEAIQAIVKRIRSIVNVEMLPAYIAPEFKPLLKQLGLPENIDTVSLINDLSAALHDSDSIDTSYLKTEESIPEQVEPEIPAGSGYALRATFPDIAERWGLVKSGSVEPFSFELSLMELVREAKTNGATSFLKAAEYIQESYPEFFPDNIETINPGGAIQAEVTFAWQHVAVLDKKALEEEKTTPTQTTITIRTSADKLSDHWDAVQKGTSEITEDDQRLINYIKEALLDGVEDEFIPIARFIDTKYPGYIPENLESLNEFSLIRGEVVSARQYLRMLEEVQIEPDISDQEGIEVPKRENVVQFNSGKASGFLPSEGTAHQESLEYLAALEKAGIEPDDIHRIVTLYAIIESKMEKEGKAVSINLIRQQKELQAEFDEIKRKGLRGGMILSQENFFDIVSSIKGTITAVTEHQDQPWLMPTDQVQGLTDLLYVTLVKDIPEDKLIEKALLVAKREKPEAFIKILSNNLYVSPSQQATDMALKLVDSVENHIRLIEIEQEIDSLLAGASEAVLSDYNAKILRSLKDEESELRYSVSTIPLTEDVIDVFRNSGSLTVIYGEIAQILEISVDAARLLTGRITEHLDAVNKEAVINSEGFQFGLSVLEKLDGFLRSDDDETTTIATRYVGPFKLLLDMPKVSESEISIDVWKINADGYHGSSDYEVFTSPVSGAAENLADQINHYVATNQTAVKTENIPAYGSLLHSGENGSKLYSTKEINKRIREAVQEGKKNGDIPKGVKLSVTAPSHSSINLRIKELPDGFQMIRPEFVGWVEKNPHGYFGDAPDKLTIEYRALIYWLEAQAEAYNYDDSDSQSDYFNTNFYLSVGASHELEDQEKLKALALYKEELLVASEPISEAESEPEKIEPIQEIPASSADELDNTSFIPPSPIEPATIDPALLSLAEEVLDLDGNSTGWKSLQIASDAVGLTQGGGTALVNPSTLEFISFKAGTRPAIEAEMRATAYAIDHPLNLPEALTEPSDSEVVVAHPEPGKETKSVSDTPEALTEEVVEPPARSKNSVTLLPPAEQKGSVAKNIARLMRELTLEQLLTDEGTELYVTVENDPYMDLVIEAHPSFEDDFIQHLYLTHYYDQNGDRCMDCELVMQVQSDGRLTLQEVASQNPLTGGEIRTFDNSFGTLFSRNLLDQDFGQGTVINHRSPDESAVIETAEANEVSDSIAKSEEDWLTGPIGEFKTHLSTLDETESTMLLAYRFGEGRPLELCESIDRKITDGTALPKDYAIFKNLRGLFEKNLDTATKEEIKNGYSTTETGINDLNATHDLVANDLGSDQQHSKRDKTNSLADNKRRDDRSESTTVNRGISGVESTTTDPRLHDSGEIPGSTASVRAGNDPETDQSNPAPSFRRALSFDPRENILQTDFSSVDRLRDRLEIAVRKYIQIQEEDRLPTEEETEALIAFSGIGKLAKSFSYPHTHRSDNGLSQALGLLNKAHPEVYKGLKASTVDSYYTPVPVIDFMWQALEHMGINTVLHPLHITEPAVGNGRFIGLAPKHIRETATFTAVEKDPFAAQIAEWTYPEANVINSGFEDIILPSKSQDIVIANPPYGDYTVYDPQDKRKRLVHDYFLKRAVELTKPGGIVAFVTSSGTMDKANSALRYKIAESADLISGFRLPDSVFEASGAKVVTDVLFFQKRHPNQQPGNSRWIETGEHLIGEEVANINQYFIDNPEHVLGEFGWGQGKFGMGVTVSGGVTVDQLRELRNKLPMNIFDATQHASHIREEKQKVFEDPRFADAKIGSYVETGEGIFILDQAGLVPHTIKGKRKEKLSALIQIRDTLLLLLETGNDGDQNAADIHRSLLNRQYDAFVERYGAISAKSNKNLLKRDPSQYVLLALEYWDTQSEQFNKSDLLSVPFQQLNTKEASIETAHDAIAFCLNARGFIDEQYVAELLDSEIEETRKGLDELCLKNPETDRWELKAIYLSGNLYDKLDKAEKAALIDSSYEKNINEIRAVLPPSIGIDEINVRLGVSWIPLHIVNDFITTQLGTHRGDDRVRLSFVEETHTWKVELTPTGRRDMRERNERELGTKALRYDELMTLTLNQKRARVKNREGDLIPEQTALAKAKQQEIVESFSQFVKSDPKYAGSIEEAYNRKFNAYKEADYDGSYMTFPGMSGTIQGKQLKLRHHQPAVVERILTSETGVVIAHEAGAGKTIEQIAAAIEMKRLGMASKPLVVIPNHMLKQATNEARDLYPNARILTATPDDFTAEGRQAFASKARLNDWDIVICTHSMFERMTVPAAFAVSHIQEEVDEFDAALSSTDHGNRIAIRSLETAKKKLESRLKATILSAQDKKDSICFGECGFDLVFYDEGHYLKNYAPPTSMSDVSGVNSTTSGRAMDAVLKADYIRHIRQDNRGFYPATGTPITNSVTEVWVMLRLAAPQILKETGLYNFDNFAATFCEVVDHVEIKPEGDGYQIKSRLSKFHNVPELIRIFRMVADIKTAEDLNLPTPKTEDIKHVAPQSKEMNLFMSWLAHRAGLVRDAQVEPSEDNLLSISSAGRLASLDLRLIHPDLPDDPDSKVNQCVKNVHDKYIQHAEDRRTQIVFCDRGTPKEGFNLYDDMKNKWISMGIPADEIAFIHDAKNDDQKEALFQKIRNGQVRIVIASTDKMGVGTNVQTRGSDMHMLDIPWRPTDLTQRRKRFERQGCLFDGINIHFYTTEDSFDLFMLETVVRKLRFITQALSNPDKAARNLDEEVDPTLSEIMAITTGNPLIKDKVEVDNAVEKHKLLFRAHQSKVRDARTQANWITTEILPSYQRSLQGLQECVKIGIPEKFEMVVGDKLYDSPKEAGLAIHKILNNKFGYGHTVATLAGFPVVTRSEQDIISLEWQGPITFKTALTKGPERFTSNLFSKLFCVDYDLERTQKKVITLQGEVDRENERAKSLYPGEEELRTLLDKQNEINIEISKMCNESDEAPGADFVHPFQELLWELDAKSNVLTADEIEVFQSAMEASTTTSSPTAGM